ncbi:hypothetical protein KA005_41440, partial [bacterium]|nr:hypothetical protein [bacterium]
VEILSRGITVIADFFGGMADAIRGVVVDTDALVDADERLIAAQNDLEESEERVTAAEEKAAESAEDLAEISAELAAAQLEVADSAREVDKLTEAYEELKGAMDAVADETENLDDLDRNIRGAKLALIDAQMKHSETLSDSEKSSHDAAKSLNRLETAQDRVSDLERDRIDIVADLAAATTEAAEIQKKNGDDTVDSLKANIDENIAANKDQYANIAVLEEKTEEAREKHAFDQEDVDREKLVYDALLKLIENTSDEKKKIMEGEAEGIGQSIGEAHTAIIGGWAMIFEALGVYIPIAYARGVELVTGIVNGIVEKYNDIKNTFEEGIHKAITYLGTVVSEMWNKGTEFIGGIVDGIVAKYHEIRDSIEEGIRQALDYLIGIPVEFFNSGVAIINGIVDGIKSAPGKIAAAVKAEFDKVNPLKPHSDADEGPFSDLEASGKAVVTTFSKGIDSAKGSVAGSFGEALESTPFAAASTGGSGGKSEKNVYEGDSISIGNVSLSRDYDFPALMKDIENYQSKKRIQRGIQTL